ncbi:unnamed protein product [Moneuplotes crassus]|uniref:Uncharacterized protein n=1 Tax=Euplotes crassus TaxID=5936 RepID=A0AAD1XQ28_EUPCR|nr:unnamed protein product [Moneuplotes crassus]
MYSHGQSPNKTVFRDSEYFGQINKFGKHFRTVDRRREIWREPDSEEEREVRSRGNSNVLSRFPMLRKKQTRRYNDSFQQDNAPKSLDKCLKPRVLVNKDKVRRKINLKKIPISNKSLSKTLAAKKSKVKARYLREPKNSSSMIDSKFLRKGDHVRSHQRVQSSLEYNDSTTSYETSQVYLNSSNSFETFRSGEQKSKQRYEILKNFTKIQRIIRNSFKYIENREKDIKRKEEADPLFDSKYSLALLRKENPEYRQHLRNIRKMGTILKELGPTESKTRAKCYPTYKYFQSYE